MRRLLAKYAGTVPVWWPSVLVLFGAGCGWAPPPVQPEETDRGLVIIYPSSVNTVAEMEAFYKGLRSAGIDQEIDVIPWTLPLLHFFIPTIFPTLERPWAEAQADRIVQYQADHPGRPVTLLGYSGGCFTCILVCEQMPEGTAMDRVIMMSPGVSTGYNLKPMLDHVRRGAMVYWSPLEDFVILVTHTVGATDGVFGDPAAAFGFQTMDDRLTQIEWGPALQKYGNNGGHTDYIYSIDWIREFVAPWVALPGTQ